MKNLINKIKFETIEEQVKYILEKYPFTRNSDHVLECMIVQEMGYGNYLFTEIMMKRKELKIPNFATIERCRRKIQSECPHLKADEETAKLRAELKNEYIQYALQGV